MSVFTNATASGQSKAYVAAILEVLGPRDPIEVLRTTPAAHRAILQHFPAPYLGIPEGPGKWSAQQLLQHLADSGAGVGLPGSDDPGGGPPAPERLRPGRLG